MRLSELLLVIEQIAKKENLAMPYIVGGLPRDKYLKIENNFNDIDLTTGNPDIHFLAKEVGVKLKSIGAKQIILEDGHSRINIGKLKLDFSSNFIIPRTEEIVGKKLNMLQQETYSRDFTCNTLLMSLDLKKIIDITGLAIPDINKKQLKTCLPAPITLAADPKRMLRAIYLSSKLGFTIDKSILDFIKQNKILLETVTSKYKLKLLAKSLKYNKQNTLSLITQLDLWDQMPLIPESVAQLGTK